MLRNLLLFLLLAPLAARADDASIRTTARSVNSTAHVQAIKKTPLPGISAVVTDGSVYYMSDDGRYLLYGILLDTKGGKNLTDDLLALARTSLLDQLHPSDLIEFPPTSTSIGTVTVFLDTFCQYCRALQSKLDSYQKAGIRLRFAPWPSGSAGSPAYRSAVDVWCADDKASALAKAMRDVPIPSARCAMEDRIPALREMGQRLGIQGTPAIFDDRGHFLGGFMSPEALAQKLREKSVPSGS